MNMRNLSRPVWYMMPTILNAYFRCVNTKCRGAGDQEALELLRLDGADERLTDFGKDHAVKGAALDGLAAHQPVEEGAGRTRVGLAGALTAYLATARRG